MYKNPQGGGGAKVKLSQFDKGTYKNPANIIMLYGERLKVCPLPSEPSKKPSPHHSIQQSTGNFSQRNNERK